MNVWKQKPHPEIKSEGQHSSTIFKFIINWIKVTLLDQPLELVILYFGKVFRYASKTHLPKLGYCR